MKDWIAVPATERDGAKSGWAKYVPAKDVRYVEAWQMEDGTWEAAARNEAGVTVAWCPGVSRSVAAGMAIALAQEKM